MDNDLSNRDVRSAHTTEWREALDKLITIVQEDLDLSRSYRAGLSHSLRRRSRSRSPENWIQRDLRRKASVLTTLQNYQMRHSPPIQPGEQNTHGRLPSFNEVCCSGKNSL